MEKFNCFMSFTILFLFLKSFSLVSSYISENPNRYDKTFKQKKVDIYKSNNQKNEHFKKNGPFIVLIKKEIPIETFQKALHHHYQFKNQDLSINENVNTQTKFHTKLFKDLLPNTVVVYGLTYHEISVFTDVEKIVPNSIKRIVGFEPVQFELPWGIDRVDQEGLPLDGKYNLNFTGADIDVYIVDTGNFRCHIDYILKLTFLLFIL